MGMNSNGANNYNGISIRQSSNKLENFGLLNSYDVPKFESEFHHSLSSPIPIKGAPGERCDPEFFFAENDLSAIVLRSLSSFSSALIRYGIFWARTCRKFSP
jgi:hypothetical protein